MSAMHLLLENHVIRSLPCFQKPTTRPILSQFNPFHTVTPCFLVDFNVVLGFRCG
jgi:hypothetical protein